jgi:hypothetical protein
MGKEEARRRPLTPPKTPPKKVRVESPEGRDLCDGRICK